VIAVLDWELSTLGHPLADVAFACIAWQTTPDLFEGIRGLDARALGLPSQAQFLARYRDAGGCEESLTTFHFVFSLFRLAVIFERIAARARSGNAAAENASDVGALAGGSARRAVELIDDPDSAWA